MGLGYVGLPLLLAFDWVMLTLGFEISSREIDAFRKGFDPMGEMGTASFADEKNFVPLIN